MKKKNQGNSRKEAEEVKDGDVPKTFEKQNLGHNAKKEGLGPNTNRQR